MFNGQKSVKLINCFNNFEYLTVEEFHFKPTSTSFSKSNVKKSTCFEKFHQDTRNDTKVAKNRCSIAITSSSAAATPAPITDFQLFNNSSYSTSIELCTSNWNRGYVYSSASAIAASSTTGAIVC